MNKKQMSAIALFVLLLPACQPAAAMIIPGRTVAHFSNLYQSTYGDRLAHPNDSPLFEMLNNRLGYNSPSNDGFTRDEFGSKFRNDEFAQDPRNEGIGRDFPALKSLRAPSNTIVKSGLSKEQNFVSNEQTHMESAGATAQSQAHTGQEIIDSLSTVMNSINENI